MQCILYKIYFWNVFSYVLQFDMHFYMRSYVDKNFILVKSGCYTGSCSSDNGSQDSLRSSSFVPSPHGTMGSSRYLAHDDILKATDGDDISIRTTEEMEKYESLHCGEFAHAHVYDVNSLDRVGLDEELPTILWTIGWGKLYNEPRLGSHLLTLEFLMTFQTVEKNRKLFLKFQLFRKSFGCDFSHFSTRKCGRLRFSDIHNPSLRFLHKWMSFTLFPMAELCSVATPELNCLFALVNRIKYTPVVDIIDYFKNVHKISGPIECTSMVTQIAMNLRCPEMANLAYIERDIPILGLENFVHAHILREKPDHSLAM
jgi:hypothetical protein